jgi:hypothetical protein
MREPTIATSAGDANGGRSAYTCEAPAADAGALGGGDSMIHHISVPARDPAHVAKILAEVWGGDALPFPPYEGAYIVIRGDEHGSAIEVVPLGAELVPGEGDGGMLYRENPTPSVYSVTHAALTVPRTQAEVEAIGAREGWRVLRSGRITFEVVEFWVENRLLFELFTPEIADQYARFMSPKNIARIKRAAEAWRR